MRVTPENAAQENALIRRVLETLAMHWPDSRTLTLDTLGLAPTPDHVRAFLIAIHFLGDSGLILFEALVAGAGRSPICHDAEITARGRALLRTLQGKG
jgi:hypothetical protein